MSSHKTSLPYLFGLIERSRRPLMSSGPSPFDGLKDIETFVEAEIPQDISADEEKVPTEQIPSQKQANLNREIEHIASDEPLSNSKIAKTAFLRKQKTPNETMISNETDQIKPIGKKTTVSDSSKIKPKDKTKDSTKSATSTKKSKIRDENPSQKTTKINTNNVRDAADGTDKQIPQRFQQTGQRRNPFTKTTPSPTLYRNPTSDKSKKSGPKVKIGRVNITVRSETAESSVADIKKVKAKIQQNLSEKNDPTPYYLRRF